MKTSLQVVVPYVYVKRRTKSPDARIYGVTDNLSQDGYSFVLSN